MLLQTRLICFPCQPAGNAKAAFKSFYLSIAGVQMAVGLSVDYALHVQHAFLATAGHSRSQRVRNMMLRISAAVILAVASTFTGVVILAGSKSDIMRTFFKLLLGTVVLGGFVGLFALPALLSLIGPAPCLLSEEEQAASGHVSEPLLAAKGPGSHTSAQTQATRPPASGAPQSFHSAVSTPRNAEPRPVPAYSAHLKPPSTGHVSPRRHIFGRQLEPVLEPGVSGYGGPAAPPSHFAPSRAYSVLLPPTTAATSRLTDGGPPRSQRSQRSQRSGGSGGGSAADAVAQTPLAAHTRGYVWTPGPHSFVSSQQAHARPASGHAPASQQTNSTQHEQQTRSSLGASVTQQQQQRTSSSLGANTPPPSSEGRHGFLRRRVLGSGGDRGVGSTNAPRSSNDVAIPVAYSPESGIVAQMLPDGSYLAPVATSARQPRSLHQTSHTSQSSGQALRATARERSSSVHDSSSGSILRPPSASFTRPRWLRRAQHGDTPPASRRSDSTDGLSRIHGGATLPPPRARTPPQPTEGHTAASYPQGLQPLAIGQAQSLVVRVPPAVGTRLHIDNPDIENTPH